MINMLQSKASAGAVNLTSDFDNIAINSIKNLSAVLKTLIFGFPEKGNYSTAILQGLTVEIKRDKQEISISPGVGVTSVGEYPFFIHKTLTKKLTDEEMAEIGRSQYSYYLVLRAKIDKTDKTENRLVKTQEGTYETQPVYCEQELIYDIEIITTPLKNEDLVFGKINVNLEPEEVTEYPILRLSRTLDQVTGFLDTANIEAKPETLMLRDNNGRSKIGTPSANGDIANKLYVDNCINTEKTARESADSTLQGNISVEATERATQDDAITKRIDDLGITARQYNGNAATATKLAKARTIKIQDSSGSNTGTEVNFDGSGNAIIKLPATIKANITGNCSGSSGSCAGNSATATKATKATQDESGNNIKASYASSLAVSGKTVTLKSKSGATLSTITTQDTTYGVATTSANGLMPKEDKNYIDKMRNYFYFGSEDSYLSAKTSGGTKYSFVMLG